jgi:hypothetical protein
MDFETLRERGKNMTYEEALIEAKRAMTFVMTMLEWTKKNSEVMDAPE